MHVEQRVTGVGVLGDVVEETVGRGHRRDPVVAGSGGPAGDARLTSWVGLVLLVLIAAELVTLLDVFGLMDWYVGMGLALTAFALLKTASTNWRIVRYYTGSSTYGSAGPPPILLRLLGPLVIAATLGVLGSGIALIAVGPARSRSSVVSLVGHPAGVVTVHAGFFVLFAVTTGLHLLARSVSALSLSTGRPRRSGDAGVGVPGKRRRIVLLVTTTVVAVLAVVLVVPSVSGWTHGRHGQEDRPAAARRSSPVSRSSAASAIVAGLLALSAVGACSASPGPAAHSAPSAVTVATPSPAPAASPSPRRSLTMTQLPVRLPTPLSRLVALAAGDHLLLLGGLDAGNHTTAGVLALSPAGGPASSAARLAEPTHDAGGAVLGGVAVVIGGGVTASTDAAQALAPNGRSAAVVGRLPEPRSDLAVATDGTTAYVVGGYTGSAELPDVLATTDGRSFRVVALLAETVRYPAAVVVGGTLWVFGGEHRGRPTADIQQVDLATGSARVAGRLPQPVAHAAAVTLDGSVLLVGGADGPVHERTVARFDPATASVTPVGALPVPVSDAAVAVLGDSAYVVGGETTDATGAVTTLDTVARLRWS